MYRTISKCPICKSKLKVTRLKCENCNSELSGEFELSPFDQLNDDQLNFALLFIICEGNIKELEKRMNISYPTVKKLLDDVKNTLGYVKENNAEESNVNLRESLKEKLKKGEISFEEVEKILGGKL